MNKDTQQTNDATDNPFANSPISRRGFARLAAATTGALTLPGAALAQVSSDKTTTVYEYVLNHTPTTDRIQTLIELTDPTGFEDLRNLDADVRTIQQPTTAAYAQLTPSQAKKVLDMDTVARLRFSPGSNPFWRLDAYDNGVFPSPLDSVDLIDFEEMIAGMNYLHQQNPDRLRFSSVGKSRGLYNFISDQHEPKNIWLAEVTNEIDNDASYREKEKVVIFNQDSGERQGPEAMFRFIEDLLTGNEPRIEPLLDDMVLLFMTNNPDGWVAKHPQYYSGERVTDEAIIRTNEYITVAPNGADPNRSYPAPGYINPEYYPAEPNGTNLTDDQPGIDDDVPEYIAEKVPGNLAIVEHLRNRGYKNLNYAFDLHGEGDADFFLESFPLNGDYDFGDLQDLYELMRSLHQAVEETDLDDLLADEDLKSIFRDINEQNAERYDISADELVIPTETHHYGTLFDMLGYSTSGDGISWMAAAEENGGLGMKTFANETVFSISEFRPKLVEAWVLGNATLIRTTIEHAAKNIETPVKTDGASTAYVTTDALTRSSANLPFPTVEGNNTVSENHGFFSHVKDELAEKVAAGSQLTRRTSVPDNAREISVRLEPTATQVRLKSTTGRTVRSFDPSTDRHGYAEPIEWTVPQPESGDWLLEFDHTAGTTDQQAIATTSVLQSADYPNPREILEFDQRAYEVSPFRFFEEYEPYIADEGTVTAITIEEVRNGALSEDETPTYDNVVVIHDDGADDANYVAALDEYVDTGGNLVVTDTGINHLAKMNNDLVGSIGSDAVFEEMLFTSYLGERSEDHPLLAGTVSAQSEVGKFVPLGYSIGDDVPMTLVDPEAFRHAGGSIAATTAGEYVSLPDDKSARKGVSAGSITTGGTGIHIIGGLLPPAVQDHLHPFGLNEYSISELGMALITNALGYEAETAAESGKDKPGTATYYQVDLVVGDPIENLRGEKGTYTTDQLLRFVHGSTDEPVMRRSDGEFSTDESVADRIESHDITVENDTATTTFTLTDGEPMTLTLASYEKVGPGWSPKTEAQQEFVDSDTRTFESGTHTLTVDLPDEDNSSDTNDPE